MSARAIPPWPSCVVAAPGPSLTDRVAAQLRGQIILAVNDAWRQVHFADALYACDLKWWDKRAPRSDQFKGARWSSLGDENAENAVLKERGVQLVPALMSSDFLIGKGNIAFGYGQNSGFQAINLAMNFGARHITLVGFDCRVVNGKDHFFGTYPNDGTFVASDYNFFNVGFKLAAEKMPPGYRIVNATPDSAITCFPMMSFADALDDRVLWNRTIDHAAAG